MHLLMIPRLALKALRQNVMRTALTMLGIIIGVGAVHERWGCARPSSSSGPTIEHPQAEVIANPDELQRVLKALRARDFTVTSIRKHTVMEHPESIFINVWKQGPALDLAKGLRFALDVGVGAAKVASNSGRE